MAASWLVSGAGAWPPTPRGEGEGPPRRILCQAAEDSVEEATTAMYAVYALSPGGRPVDWSTRLYLEPPGQTTSSAYFLWLLRGPQGSVLVDPRDIAHVLLTHLHWDHFDLEGFLPRATFWVQRREVEFWQGYGGQDPWVRRFLSDCFQDDLA